MAIKRISDGARRLRRYLNEIESTLPVFCEKHGLDRIQVQRYLKGQRHRATVDFAAAIEKASDGAVPWYTWHTRTLSSVEPEPTFAHRRTGTEG